VKKSFALLTTLLLVVVFSFLSVRIVETNLMSSNLNKLKYLHLNAIIYMDTIIEFIHLHNDFEIENFENAWNDERFTISINKEDSNSSIYYTSIETVDESHIRLSQKVIK
jgi:hypothetical protein